MRPISRNRFNALAGYARNGIAHSVYKELAWFMHADERVLGVVGQDLIDGDYSGVVLARDRLLRYRALSVTKSERTQRRAEVYLRIEMELMALAPDEDFSQGDEEGELIDFFEPPAPGEALNPGFRILLEKEGYLAAKKIIIPVMPWFGNPDRNFIQQFRTTGFDARIWELFLYCVFNEVGYSVERFSPTTESAPDFHLRGNGISAAVEAVTVNPSNPIENTNNPPNVPNKIEIAATKFSRALASKLKKKYWNFAHVKEKPCSSPLFDQTPLVVI